MDRSFALECFDFRFSGEVDFFFFFESYFAGFFHESLQRCGFTISGSQLGGLQLRPLAFLHLDEALIFIIEQTFLEGHS